MELTIKVISVYFPAVFSIPHLEWCNCNLIIIIRDLTMTKHEINEKKAWWYNSGKKKSFLIFKRRKPSSCFAQTSNGNWKNWRCLRTITKSSYMISYTKTAKNSNHYETELEISSIIQLLNRINNQRAMIIKAKEGKRKAVYWQWRLRRTRISRLSSKATLPFPFPFPSYGKV